MSDKIKTHQAKYTLVQLHAELAGKIIDNEKQAHKLREDMKHVEAVIKLMEPDYNINTIAVRRKESNRFFKRGTIFRSAVDIMRRAERPLTCREIVEALLAAKGIEKPTLKDYRTLVGGVQSSLRNHDGKTIVSDGLMPARWTIKG
jgi:hypothetical protein